MLFRFVLDNVLKQQRITPFRGIETSRNDGTIRAKCIYVQVHYMPQRSAIMSQRSMTSIKQLTTLEIPNESTDSVVGEPVQGVLLERGVVCDLSVQALNRDVQTATIQTTPRTYVHNAHSVHHDESKDGIEVIASETDSGSSASKRAAPYSVNCVLLEAGSGKRLSKEVGLSAAGAITTRKCSFGVSRAAPKVFETLKSFGDFIDRLQPNQAISIGSIIPGVKYVDGFAKVVGKDLVTSHNRSISRSLRFFEFRAQRVGLMLIDIDLKGITHEVEERIAAEGGVWNLFCAIWPELLSAGYLQRGSTSSGIFNSSTGQTFPSSGGAHIYVLVKDQSDIPRALRAMQDRLCALDLNWAVLTKIGNHRVGCLVDIKVGSPERIIFEGAPEVVPPLQQRPRASAFAGGDIVDTLAVFKDIVLEVSTQGPTDAAIAPTVTNEDGSEGMEKPVTERSAIDLLAHQVDQERMISQIRRAHHFDQLPHDATLALCYNRGASMRTEFWQFGEIQQMVSWIAARGCSFNYYLGENTFRPDSK